MTRITAIVAGLALSLAAQGAPAQSASVPPVRVRYMVQDVTTTVAFYTTNLGFKLETQSGPYFAWLTRGGVSLLISPVKGPGGASRPMPDGRVPVPGGWNRIVLYTADIQGDVDRLKKAGVHFRNDVVSGLGGKEILLEDPSGNPVELFQPG